MGLGFFNFLCDFSQNFTGLEVIKLLQPIQINLSPSCRFERALSGAGKATVWRLLVFWVCESVYGWLACTYACLALLTCLTMMKMAKQGDKGIEHKDISDACAFCWASLCTGDSVKWSGDLWISEVSGKNKNRTDGERGKFAWLLWRIKHTHMDIPRRHAVCFQTKDSLFFMRAIVTKRLTIAKGQRIVCRFFPRRRNRWCNRPAHDVQ